MDNLVDIEIWEKIKDFPTYEVSNKGNVRKIEFRNNGVPGKNLIHRSRTKNARPHVHLYEHRIPYITYLDRAVSEAFLPRGKVGQRLVHIDGDIKNNNVNNLTYK